jgi:hypothetical protein
MPEIVDSPSTGYDAPDATHLNICRELVGLTGPHRTSSGDLWGLRLRTPQVPGTCGFYGSASRKFRGLAGLTGLQPQVAGTSGVYGSASQVPGLVRFTGVRSPSCVRGVGRTYGEHGRSVARVSRVFWGGERRVVLTGRSASGYTYALLCESCRVPSSGCAMWLCAPVIAPHVSP